MTAADNGAHRDVVVVGADPLLAALVDHGLAAAGFRVTCVDAEAEPVPSAAHTVVDVPDAADVAAAVSHAARRFDAAPDARRTTLVFLVPRGVPADVLAAIRAGGHEFVTKPFDLGELVARVRASAPAGRGVARPQARRRAPWGVVAAAVAGVAFAVAVPAVLLVANGGATGRAPAATATATPTATPTPAQPAAVPQPSAPASTSPAAPATPSRLASAATCGSPAARGRAALRLLRDPEWVSHVHVSFRRGRPDVLAVAHADGNAVDVFVRSCADEPLREIAAATVDQVAQVRSTRWSASTAQEWLRRRGIGAATRVEVAADVGSVATLWQLGTTRWWRSPFSPPSRVSSGLVSLLRH